MRNGYKMTEVGFIPEDWVVTTISEVGKIRKGRGISRDSVEDRGCPCVRYGEIYTDYNFIVRKTKSFISEETAKFSEQISCGEILFTGSGETAEDIGKAVVYQLDTPGYAGGDILILHPDNGIVDSTFLSFQWETELIRTQRRKSGQGASIYHLYADSLRKFLVLIPPLPEQQKIADILTTVDDHIIETEALIEKTKVLKQGLMQQLLTKGIGHTEFKDTEIGRIPLEWEVYTVKSICKICTGKRNTQDKIDDAEYPFFVRSKNIERIDEFDFDEEAVLTAGDGVGTGKVFHYIVGKFAVHQRVYKMSHFTSVDGKYFFYYFSENFIFRVKKMSAKNSVDSVRLEMIADMLLPLPELPEQRQIAAILTSVDDQIDTYQAKLASLTRLKTGLMQQLLTGKIRVKV